MAAELEDTAEEAGSPFNHFSDVIPEVASARRVEKTIGYRANDYILPALHFPIVITSTSSQGSEHIQKIMDAQSTIIKRIEGYPARFYVPASLDVQPIGDLTLHRSLKEKYEAEGVKAKKDDFGFSGHKAVTELVQPLITADKLQEVLADVDTDVESLRAATFGHLSAVAPWFDPEDSLDCLSWECKQVLTAIRKTAEQANESDDDLLSISGDTYAWKNDIKAAAKRYESDGYAKWDRVNKAWKIKRGAYKLLINDNPTAESDLKVA